MSQVWFVSKRALGPNGVYIMAPGSMSAVFQAMILGPLISMAGRSKMGMLMWKPFDKDDVAFLFELHEAGKLKPSPIEPIR